MISGRLENILAKKLLTTRCWRWFTVSLEAPKGSCRSYL